jgi:hypothetical protein
VNFRPSNIARFDKCSGWWRVPPAPSAEGDSAVAEKGTALHAVMAKVVGGHEVNIIQELPPDESQAVYWALFAVAEVVVIGGCATELPLVWSDMGMTGTADLVAIGDNVVHIVDWKFGRGDVEDAQDNLQLAAYAIMASLRWPDVEQVVVHVVQPFMRRHDQYAHTRETIQAAAQQIAEIRMRAEAVTTLTPGHPQCDWCPGRANCPALAETTAMVASTPETAILAATAQALANYADAARLARKCADAIDAELKRRLQSGETIPGYVLQSRTTRELTSIGEAFKRLGIPAPQFLECCKASITKLTEAFRKDNNTTAANAKAFISDSLSDIIETVETVAIKREARK